MLLLPGRTDRRFVLRLLTNTALVRHDRAMPDHAEPVVASVGLAKRFGTTEALAGLDLTMSHRRVLAVLGPTSWAS